MNESANKGRICGIVVSLCAAALSLNGEVVNLFSNGGFESGSSIANGAKYGTLNGTAATTDAWKLNTSAFLSVAGSPYGTAAWFIGGTYCAILDGTAKLAQDVEIAATCHARLTYRFMRRPNNATGLHKQHVEIDGVKFGETLETVEGDSFPRTAVFDGIELSSGTHEIRIVNEAGGGIFIDDVVLEKMPSFAIESVPVQFFDGENACEPKPAVVAWDGTPLVEGSDFDYAWADNEAVGRGVVTAVGKNAHAGESLSVGFRIVASDRIILNGGFEDGTAIADNSGTWGIVNYGTTKTDFWFGGPNGKSTIILSKAGSAHNCTAAFVAGTYCAVLQGVAALSQDVYVPADCKAELTYRFMRRPGYASGVSTHHVEVDGVKFGESVSVENGDATEKSVTFTDIPLTAGEHVVRIVNDVNSELHFDDVQMLMLPPFKVAPIETQFFDGETALRPKPAVTLEDGTPLVEGEDFEYSWSANKAVGTGYVTITGLNTYAGLSWSVGFKIASAYGEGQVLYVSPSADGSADEDCSNWEKGGTLAKACSLAQSGTTAAPTVILLKSGTVADPVIYDYSKETGRDTYATLTADNVIIRSVSLDREATVICGGGSAMKMRCLDVRSGAKIMGLTIRDFGSTSSLKGGVVLYAQRNQKTLTLDNCVFTNNAVAGSGGVLCKVDMNKIVATNCLFAGNSAQHGGVAYTETYMGAGFDVFLYDCEFIANSATGNGGALYKGGPSIFAYDCTFRANEGNLGSATYAVDCTRCHFVQNHGANNTSPAVVQGTFDGCIFTANTANLVNNTGFATFWNYNSAIRFVGCTFNDSAQNLGQGGSFERCSFVRCGGLNKTGGTYANCLMISNAAPSGGLLEGAATLTNCTIVCNTGSHLLTSKAGAVVNCVFADNALNQNCYEIGFDSRTTTSAKLVNSIFTTGTAYDSENTIQLGVTENPAGGVYQRSDLRFIGKNERGLPEWAPRHSSICVNAGANVCGYDAGSTDLGRKPRVVESIVDIGCYECQPGYNSGMIVILR